MKTTIEVRLVDNGKWNKEIRHIAKEMMWNTHKDYDSAEQAEKELADFRKKQVYYEFRIRPDTTKK